VRRPLIATALLGSIVMLAGLARAEPPPDSAGAKLTREKKLKLKITLDVKEMMLRDIITELRGAVRDAKGGDLRIKPGTGITLTSRFTVMAKEEPLEDVLDKLLKQREWGYYVVVAKPGDQDDGAIMLVTDPVRGYPPDDPRSGKSDDKGKKDAAKEKKDVAKSKTDEPKKGTGNTDEKTAANRLDFAENYIAGGKPEKAKPILKEIVEKYPNTKAAEEAKKLLEKLDK